MAWKSCAGVMTVFCLIIPLLISHALLQGSSMVKAISAAACGRQAGGHLSADSADALVGCFKRRLHSYTYLYQG
jgi:hypothetical protein